MEEACKNRPVNDAVTTAFDNLCIYTYIGLIYRLVFIHMYTDIWDIDVYKIESRWRGLEIVEIVKMTDSLFFMKTIKLKMEHLSYSHTFTYTAAISITTLIEI